MLPIGLFLCGKPLTIREPVRRFHNITQTDLAEHTISAAQGLFENPQKRTFARSEENFPAGKVKPVIRPELFCLHGNKKTNNYCSDDYSYLDKHTYPANEKSRHVSRLPA